MPIVSIDWTKIKSLYAGGTYFVALTDRHIAILSSLAEQLRWTKTWRVPDYDFADKDTLDLEVDDLIANLTMPVSIVDIIGYIDEIEDLLRGLQQTAQCCGPVDVSDGDLYTDPVTDGVGDVPQDVIDAGYATGVSDWTGFDDYKCMMSHVMVDNMTWQVTKLAEVVDDRGVILGGIGTVAAIIATIVAAIASGGVTILVQILGSVAAAGSIWTTISKIGTEALEDTAADLVTYHDDLACSIYNADGTAGAIVALKDKIDELFSAPVATMLKTMNIDVQIKALYAGRYDQESIAQAMADNGLDPDDYDCTCVPSASCDDGNELVDCSFESGDFGNGWNQIAGTGGAFQATNPYEGTYRLYPSWIGAGDYTKYVYQNFTASASGTVRIQTMQLWYGGAYNNAARLYQGANQVGSEYSLNTTHDANWNAYNQLTDWSVTQGVTYQLRLYWGYQYMDNVKLSIE